MTLTLATLSRQLAEGKTTARQLVDHCLTRIVDPAGEGARAFISVDADGARAAADYMDGLRARGRAPSPFAGIPISVKDLFDLAGEVTTAGSAVLRDAPPALRDAPAIARLKAAGFVVLGRTNMTEFAYSGLGLNPHYGTPRAPYERAAVGRIPGGSSAGAGVSVADGMAALGIGTDTGGSCRIPAAYCGIVGWKPSTGRVPLAGTYPLAPSLDSIGPLANSVACAAAADAIMAGDWDGVIPPRAVGQLRFGVPRDFVLDALEPAVASAFDAALAALQRAGVSIVDIAFPELSGLPEINAKGGISAVEAYAHHAPLMERAGAAYDPRVRTRIASGAAISAPEFTAILKRRKAMIARAGQLFNGLDGFILPTVPILPPPVSAFARDEDYARLNFLSLRNTFVGNFLDCCAISLPMTPPGAAPAGLMLMGPHGTDQAIFAAAAAVESALQN